jgi:hypothetical protein
VKRHLALAAGLFGAAFLSVLGEACNSTSSNQGGTDASAQSHASPEASVTACAAAGGQCLVGAVCGAISVADCAGGAVCCLDVICAPDAQYDIPPQGSSYDQSCTADSDCVAVGFGNACLVCEIGCVANAAISKSAEAQYRSDVAKTPANGVDCGCPEELPGGPCCIGGMCQFGSRCLATDAAADTGADAAAVDAAIDAATDGGSRDADACAPSGGCTADCVAGRHNVTAMVDGCLVTECCVPDDAGTD